MFDKKNYNLSISIPNPCQENWDEMTIAEKGRMCSACKTVVKDFSGLSDSEIIDELQNTNSKICGRFLATQLNRELEGKATRSIIRHTKLGKIAASLLMLLSLQNEAAKITSKTTSEHSIAAHSSLRLKDTTTTSSPIIIKGKVIDHLTYLPIKDIVLIIKGTSFKCSTDQYGQFKFELPGTFMGHDVIIETAPASALIKKGAHIVPPQIISTGNGSVTNSLLLYSYPSEKFPPDPEPHYIFGRL